MGRKSIDIYKRLNWIRNVCDSKYSVMAVIEHTKRGVPYVKVGVGNVRIIIFAKTRMVRVFYMVPGLHAQQHEDFPLGLHGNVDGWVDDVAAFAIRKNDEFSHPSLRLSTKSVLE